MGDEGLDIESYDCVLCAASITPEFMQRLFGSYHIKRKNLLINLIRLYRLNPNQAASISFTGW